VQEPFGKVDWPNVTTDNININGQSKTKNENRKRTSHIVWPNTGQQHMVW
jgi:type VI protein secretion system component VasK